MIVFYICDLLMYFVGLIRVNEHSFITEFFVTDDLSMPFRYLLMGCTINLQFRFVFITGGQETWRGTVDVATRCNLVEKRNRSFVLQFKASGYTLCIFKLFLPVIYFDIQNVRVVVLFYIYITIFVCPNMRFRKTIWFSLLDDQLYIIFYYHGVSTMTQMKKC
jgi:hypothetical protein